MSNLNFLLKMYSNKKKMSEEIYETARELLELANLILENEYKLV